MEHVFITGANRGIGLELVRQYLHRDARVFAACRNPQNAEALNTLSRTHPERLTVVPLELTQRESVYAAAQAVAKQTERIDVLYNNAGINPDGAKQRLETAQAETLLEILHVNAVAPLIVVQAFLELLKNGKQSRIINLSSDMGSIEERDYGGYYGYCTSKAALNMIARAMAVDLRHYDIISIALDPGWVQTDMGGDGATLTPSESVVGILEVVSRLTQQDNGSYLRWNGDTLPW